MLGAADDDNGENRKVLSLSSLIHSGDLHLVGLSHIWSRTALQLGISIIISIVLMLILMLAGRIARMSWLLGQGLAQPWSRLCDFECFVSFG